MSRKSRSGRSSDKSVYRALVMVTQFGINMLVPIGMMSALGIWLDGKFGTSYCTVLLFFVGAAAGARNVFRMARQVYDVNGDVNRDVNRNVNGKEVPGSVHEDNGNAEKQK